MASTSEWPIGVGRHQQPAIADFSGQNNFEVGADTAAPAVGTPGTGSRGTIQGGALESSNVDIATEFTNLIVYQRSYEANSRVISTLDELTQDLLNLKQ